MAVGLAVDRIICGELNVKLKLSANSRFGLWLNAASNEQSHTKRDPPSTTDDDVLTYYLDN
ncbi:hypothetical protein D3C76_1363530 [compost metagenome]